MNVLCSKPMGLCAGVRRALTIAQRIERPETVTIDGELVHNEAVQARLASRGFRIAEEQDRDRLPATSHVLITAHGASERRRRWLRGEGKRLIDTTCPLVRNVQRKARQLEADGYHVLVIGHRDHVEVMGIVEDLSSYDVVCKVADVMAYPHDRLGIVCQTTTAPSVADEIHLAIRLRNLRAQVRFEDTICRATCRRQRALRKLLPRVDAMVVVGGRRSNNTCALAALARRHRVPTYHIQSAGDLRPDWFGGCRTAGLTAGTSTDEQTICEVYEALCRIPGQQSHREGELQPPVKAH